MAAKQPNILWICTDQQRHDTIGALGNSHIHTPTLDSLVAEGVAFTSAYCQTPICTPSRASFLTGRYPSHVGVNSNSNVGFPDEARLITRTLADVGYDCGMAGKLHLSTVYKPRRTAPRRRLSRLQVVASPPSGNLLGSPAPRLPPMARGARRGLVRLLSDATVGDEGACVGRRRH